VEDESIPAAFCLEGPGVFFDDVFEILGFFAVIFGPFR
jgi:hypothetical protein